MTQTNSKPINTFPGYEYVNGKNIFRGVDMGRGGYIISWPGIYTNVALLDVESLHPNSAINMNYFGEHTEKFKELLQTRIVIKHGRYDEAKKMFDGKLEPYLNDESDAKNLAYALKIAINSVYGLTSAKFDNPFRDKRNVNNIVALRGALFMKTLQDEVLKRGYKIVAIKTDSIKIVDATKEIIDFCMDFAHKYGYNFAHEATYKKICQINDADYIAMYESPEKCDEMYGYIPDDNVGHGGKWTATGAQFQQPYVFKTLFSHEPIKFEDLCETKTVTSALYLDMNESLPDVSEYEKELDARAKGKHVAGLEDISDEDLKAKIAEGHSYCFIGKAGSFCPVKPGTGGGLLVREKNGKYYSATGAKGYRWLESEMVRTLHKESDIDHGHGDALVNQAVNDISKYGDFEWFVSDDDEDIPWNTSESH